MKVFCTVLVFVTISNADRLADLERKFETEFLKKDEFHPLKIELQESRGRVEDLEARVARLEELSKVTVLRSCAEYSQFGFSTSGVYLIDPDGPLLGETPFKVSNI